jgi:archaellum component FlaG (FlaF/FlaG flagellin family)
MATTCTINISSDIAPGFGSVSKSMTLTQAGTATDIEETTGFSRRRLAATTLVDLIIMADASLIQETDDNKAHKVYIKNIGDGKGNIDKTQYVTVGIGDIAGTPQQIGRLYGDDWMLFPVTGVDGQDVTVQPSNDNPVVLEFVMFYEV